MDNEDEMVKTKLFVGGFWKAIFFFF